MVTSLIIGLFQHSSNPRSRMPSTLIAANLQCGRHHLMSACAVNKDTAHINPQHPVRLERAMIQYFSDTSLLGSGGGATGLSFSSSLGLFTCHLAHPTYVDMQAAYIFGCLSDQHVPHNKSMSCTFDSTSEFHMNHVL